MSDRRFTEVLPVKLTDAEVLAHGEALAKLSKDLSVAEEAKRESAAEFAAEIKQLRNQMGALSAAINERREFRDVQCHERPDYERGLVQIFREDTVEEVRTRPMTDDDRQGKIIVLPGKA